MPINAEQHARQQSTLGDLDVLTRLQVVHEETGNLSPEGIHTVLEALVTERAAWLQHHPTKEHAHATDHCSP